MADEQTTATENPVEETSILGSEASDNQDWRTGFEEEGKHDPTIQNIKDVESAAKTLIHQQKMLGSRIPIPKTDEEKSELYGKLGRPEKSDQYEISIPDTHNQYFQDENIKNFKAVAHNIGLNNDQVQKLIDYQVESINYQTQQAQSNLESGKGETESLLRKEWGFEYDKNVRSAQRAMKVYGDEELTALMNTEAGNHPAVVRLFARLGKEVTEDMAKNTQNNRLAVSPLDAKAEIEKIFSDTKHPYHNAGSPEHLNAVEKVKQLHEKVYGN